MEYALLVAFAITVAAVLTIMEGRKDRRRQAPIRPRRPAHDWIDASEGIRFEQPIHYGTSGHHHSHDTGHHGGGFDCGGSHDGRGHH